ncbi:MAG TPA: response regulator [Burkholderiaceae bacterium]|nr:response regulator [Burkholderiaceae bacterium]
MDVTNPAQQKILVVDDEPDAREAMCTLLELAGHEVRSTAGGREAIDVFAEWRPHAVLLDLDLPDISGYDVARSLRASSKRVMLIAITGWSAYDSARRSEAAGFDAFLEKPVPFNRLNDLLALLARRTATRSASGLV